LGRSISSIVSPTGSFSVATVATPSAVAATRSGVNFSRSSGADRLRHRVQRARLVGTRQAGEHEGRGSCLPPHRCDQRDGIDFEFDVDGRFHGARIITPKPVAKALSPFLRPMLSIAP